MKTKIFAFFVLIIIALSLIFFIIYQSHKKGENRIYSEIYSQILTYRPPHEAKNFLTDCLSGQGKLLISSESNISFTSRGESWQEVSALDLQQIQNSTWKDFSQANSLASNFPSNLSLGCEYTLVNLKTMEPTSNCPVVMLSKIGFNATRTQALAWLRQSCGQSIGVTFFLLDLVDGQWQVTDTVSPQLSYAH
jgi:hypothetical protein